MFVMIDQLVWGGVCAYIMDLPIMDTPNMAHFCNRDHTHTCMYMYMCAEFQLLCRTPSEMRNSLGLLVAFH